jgi:hypothetical protein
MYGVEAQSRTRCTARRKDGAPCGAFAAVDDPYQRCNIHAGRHHRGPQDPRRRWRRYRSRRPPCTCRAYPFPHRPAGGFCRWPLPPLYRLNIAPGTHSWPRFRSKEILEFKRLFRLGSVFDAAR